MYDVKDSDQIHSLPKTKNPKIYIICTQKMKQKGNGKTFLSKSQTYTNSTICMNLLITYLYNMYIYIYIYNSKLR